MTSKNTKKLAMAGLMAALCYISFAFLKIDIPIGPDGKTAIHLANTFVVLGALCLGGVWGGLAGAVGLSLADLTGGYVTSAPKTFILKLLIGLVVGLVAHTIFKIREEKRTSKIQLFTLISTIAGLGFNVFADPIVGYFYKQYILGQPQEMAKVLAKFGAFATLINAVIGVILSTALYLALRPALRKMDIL